MTSLFSWLITFRVPQGSLSAYSTSKGKPGMPPERHSRQHSVRLRRDSMTFGRQRTRRDSLLCHLKGSPLRRTSRQTIPAASLQKENISFSRRERRGPRDLYLWMKTVGKQTWDLLQTIRVPFSTTLRPRGFIGRKQSGTYAGISEESLLYDTFPSMTLSRMILQKKAFFTIPSRRRTGTPSL